MLTLVPSSSRDASPRGHARGARSATVTAVIDEPRAPLERERVISELELLRWSS